jgi:hypothetical protein
MFRQTLVGGIRQAYNAYCSEMGVQCTVGLDVGTYTTLYHFTNVGDRLVKITHDDQIRYLEPGEEATLKSNTYNVRSDDASNFPVVVAFHRDATNG